MDEQLSALWQETTELVDTGILDSLATLKLLMFIEDELGVTIEPSEANSENLQTLQSICRLVESKS